MGGLEIGQQTLRFSGIRYIQGALQSGPILLVMSVLMLDLDNNPDPGRAENKLLGQLGGPLLVLTYTFAAINVLIILAADLKPKKTRVSRLKPVDTCGVSIKERSTVLVVSACEVVSSTFLFALLIHVQGAQHAALYMLAFYALLVFGWRWWTRRIKDRKGVFLFALVFSIPNMLGSFFTAGMCACAHAWTRTTRAISRIGGVRGCRDKLHLPVSGATTHDRNGVSAEWCVDARFPRTPCPSYGWDGSADLAFAPNHVQ